MKAQFTGWAMNQDEWVGVNCIRDLCIFERLLATMLCVKYVCNACIFIAVTGYKIPALTMVAKLTIEHM